MKLDVEKLINELTIEEKANLLSGYTVMSTMPIKRLNIPSVNFSDGPLGIRKLDEGGNSLSGITESLISTCFPSPTNLASSFNKENSKLMGEVISDECKYYNIQVMLAPAINIKRNPLCGRNFEYLSEDPFLTSEIIKGYINTLEHNGIGSCLKHFACNNNETIRYYGNSIVDERAMFEIYFKAFRDLTKNGHPFTYMSSYNQINGTYASDNDFLLNKTLRDKFKFNGLVMTDWGGLTLDRVSCLIHGTDLEMPGMTKENTNQIIESIRNKTLDIEVLNNSVRNLLNLINKLDYTKHNDVYFESHYEVSKKIATDSIVLLKNDDQILPLKKNKSILCVGSLFKKNHYQGSGSSLLNPAKLTSIEEAFINNNVNFKYLEGYLESETKINKKLEKVVLKNVNNYDYILYFCGLTDYEESEGFDRETLKINENQIHLLGEILKLNKNVILVLQNGGVIEIPYNNELKGIVETFLLGEAIGDSLYSILFGEVSPSGRLPETFVKSMNDIPFINEFNKQHEEYYKESIYVGYRYYQSVNKEVLYPFGYGLSYAKFSYSNFNIEKVNDGIKVKFTIKNESDIEAKEVSQIYFSKEDSDIFRPLKELIFFTKTLLKPYEIKEIEGFISFEDLKIYDVNSKTFKLEDGEYKFILSKDALNEISSLKVSIEGEKLVNKFSKLINKYYKDPKNLLNVTDDAYYELLGYKPQKLIFKRPYTLETPIKEFKTLYGKIFIKIMLNQADKKRRKAKRIKDPFLKERELKAAVFMKKLTLANSLRSLCFSSSGLMSYNFMLGILALVNNHPIKAIKYFMEKS